VNDSPASCVAVVMVVLFVNLVGEEQAAGDPGIGDASIMATSRSHLEGLVAAGGSGYSSIWWWFFGQNLSKHRRCLQCHVHIAGIIGVTFSVSGFYVKTLIRLGLNDDGVLRHHPLGGVTMELRCLLVPFHCHRRASLDLISKLFQHWCGAFSVASYLIHVT
jgi:hypothetical protein